MPERRSGERTGYHTVGGLVVTTLGRIPRSGEGFEAHALRFEVVDMDGHRVDKVLVSRPPVASGDLAVG
jgi:putative hemolysin